MNVVTAVMNLRIPLNAEKILAFQKTTLFQGVTRSQYVTYNGTPLFHILSQMISKRALPSCFY